MPQYAILTSHEAGICPLTNKQVRAFVKKAFAGHDELGKKFGVKKLMEVHLDPAHRSFVLFEAKSAEAVRDFIVEAGYMHFTSPEFFLVTPVAEIFKHIDDAPTLY